MARHFETLVGGGGWEAHRAGSPAHTYIHTFTLQKWALVAHYCSIIFFERSIWLVSQRNKDHFYSHTVFPFMSQLVQKTNSSLASRTCARRNGVKPTASYRLFPQGIHLLKDRDKDHDNYMYCPIFGTETWEGWGPLTPCSAAYAIVNKTTLYLNHHNYFTPTSYLIDRMSKASTCSNLWLSSSHVLSKNWTGVCTDIVKTLTELTRNYQRLREKDNTYLNQRKTN